MSLRHAAALFLLASGVARGADLNAITAVTLANEGGSIVLSIKGSKPPNFTTFSMADPPRFVIDLSEARFQNVPPDVVVQDGVVNVVKNLSYGSDATSIARVMIAFMVEVEPPDVSTVGQTLVVRVAKPVGAAAPVAASGGAARADAERKAEAERKADAERKLEAERKAQEETQAAARAAAAADAERKAQEETQAAARAAAADAERKAQEETQAAARADAERKATAEAEARAKADADRLAAEQARLARETYERERQEALHAESQARADADARAAEDRARAEAEARAAAESKAQAEQRAAAQAEAAKPTKAEGVAEPESPAAAPDAAPQPEPVLAESPAPSRADDALDAGAPRARLREIGFRQLPGVSRVFLRTSVTPRFSIQDVSENVVRVELENTRASRGNDTRFLDTSFFPSAVALVTPTHRGSSYVVEIKLRERVPYQQRIEGDMLAIDFERPAAVAPATSPTATAPAGELAPAALEGAPPAAEPAAAN